MRSLLLSPAAVVAAALLSACSTSADPPAGMVCSSAADCPRELCLRSTEFPNGYCSQACDPEDEGSCPRGSYCIDDASGAPPDSGVTSVCYQGCATDDDCQHGLTCSEKEARLVCRAGQ